MKTLPSDALAPSGPYVEIVDRHPVTSSRKVAEYFGKDHKNVLQSIQTLPCSPKFTELNFQPSEYTDSTGRKLPEYLLTKNGFVFLVMGFTGARAASLKEAYIAEFDRMEETIRRMELSGKSPSQKPLAHEEDLELRRATPIQRLILVILARHVGPDGFCEVNQQKLASETGLSRSAVNRNLKCLELLGLIASRQIPGEHLKRYEVKSGRSPFSLSGTSGGPVPAFKSGRPGIDPATLDTPIPEGLLERRQSYCVFR
ncbi:MAG: Rha family transcriptional regulator [Leptospirales bacterium]